MRAGLPAAARTRAAGRRAAQPGRSPGAPGDRNPRRAPGARDRGGGREPSAIAATPIPGCISTRTSCPPTTPSCGATAASGLHAGPGRAGAGPNVGELLRARFGKELIYADDGVVTLRPGRRIGTYEAGAPSSRALSVVTERLGCEGAVPGHASALARNVHAFELLVGAYAVAHLRVTERIKAHGGALPDDGAHVVPRRHARVAQRRDAGIALSLRSLDEETVGPGASRDTRVLVCLRQSARRTGR